MGKIEATREDTERDVNCLKNLVVAYNTVFLMSSIFIVSIAATTHELFSDFYRLLSPSVLLLMVGGFIVLLAGLGYLGVAKNSSTLISIYTLMLVFIFILEIAAGIGILSFRGEIKPLMFSKMKKAIAVYPDDPMTANIVDFVQLHFRCCGVNNYWDWDEILDSKYGTNCRAADVYLPQSCCRKFENSTIPKVNKKGCLPILNFNLHKSSLLISTAIIAICTIQILGTYFSYSLASTLYRLKSRKENQRIVSSEKYEASADYKEKINYF